MNDEWLTTAEASTELGISQVAVRARLESGSMRGKLLSGRQWIISRSEVERAKAEPPRRGRPPKLTTSASVLHRP